jgi:heterotetrameric sarcosine oxidase gamma subunit
VTLTAGTKLGPYEILLPIGAGGMGEVYRARDAKLQRDVAIKVLPQVVANDPETLARFEREALAVASLSHPNILAIHDFGNEGGVAYAVTGARAAALLAARCPLDFHVGAFPVGTCAQSLLGHVGALYYRRDAEDFVVMVARSYARDAWDALCVSAAAGGYDVAPPAMFD